MKLKPLGDRIVVKVLSEEKKTKGGIVLPDTAKDSVWLHSQGFAHRTL